MCLCFQHNSQWFLKSWRIWHVVLVRVSMERNQPKSLECSVLFFFICAYIYYICMYSAYIFCMYFVDHFSLQHYSVMLWINAFKIVEKKLQQILVSLFSLAWNFIARDFLIFVATTSDLPQYPILAVSSFWRRHSVYSHHSIHYLLQLNMDTPSDSIAAVWVFAHAVTQYCICAVSGISLDSVRYDISRSIAHQPANALDVSCRYQCWLFILNASFSYR